MSDRKKHSCVCSGKVPKDSEAGLRLENTAPSPGRHQRRPRGTWRIWLRRARWFARGNGVTPAIVSVRSEEHTSELQTHSDLVCRLLLEKKKKNLDRMRVAPWRRASRHSRVHY